MHAEWGEVPQATADADRRRARAAVASCDRHDLAAAARIGGAPHDGAVRAWTGETDIFITPGFRFRVVDLLLTNFHLPRSTLFMLVAAFAGLERMKAAYAHAVARAIPLLFLRRLLSVAAMSLSFELLGTDGAARRGRITTAHGTVETPAFMPVGTARHGEGDAAAVGRRDRRRDRARQHLPPDAAAGRRARGARWAACTSS